MTPVLKSATAVRNPNPAAASSLDVYTTCPPYGGGDRQQYLRRVVSASQWSDAAGCRGMLVYTDNGLLDPWLVAQIVLQNTRALAPLVAVQPVYMHPYTVAKMVSTLGYLYGRGLCLNMVAGGFRNDLVALSDTTPHDRRYTRLIEYTQVIQRLLAGETVTFTGEYYRVEQLSLKPPLPTDLAPLFTVSGSSPAGLAAAAALGAIPVAYPEPPEKCAPVPSAAAGQGIRVGVIARASEEDAWTAAYRRFPCDRAGQLKHNLAMKVSDSSWHRTLSDLGERLQGKRSPYWLWPFENYKGFCPYLVGSYEQVAAEIDRYVASGCRTFILDVPESEEELGHTASVFGRVRQGASAPC
jgi:alkanesulfonate monooxygenase